MRSAAAKYLAAYIKATGTTDTKDLAEALGVSLRTIQRHKIEIAECGAQATTVVETGTTKATTVVATTATTHVATEATTVVVDPPRVHARIETPSGLSSTLIGREDSPSSVPLKRISKPKPASPRGARLQPDWALPDDWFDWTRINFAHATPELIHLEAEKFRDYWTAKSGQQAAKLDWQATWRNWCRTAFAARPATVRQRPAEEHWQERKRREAREFYEMCLSAEGGMQ